MITCPNCKEKYKWGEQDRSHKKYPFHLVHYNQTCPFGISVYQKTKEKALESAREHILKKFPWITREHSHLKD